MLCKNCGSLVEDGQKFCSVCGINQAEDSTANGTLYIERKKSLADMAVGYKIILDGQEVAKIKQGESFSFNLHSGTHNLQLKLHWCTSRLIEFKIDNEHLCAQFECYTIFKGLFAVITGFILPKKYITLNKK